MKRKIEAIIICKNYSDFLEITLPLNQHHFDNIVVVTSHDDESTKNLCAKLNINFIIYNDFNKNGAKFNFGGARKCGLQNLKYNDWVIILDGDIIMPNNFRELFDIDTRDIEKFYGSYRRFIPCIEDYYSLVSNQKSKEEFIAIEGSGCGFWQCFNLNSRVSKYHGINNLYKDSYSAENVDIEFMKLWCPMVEHDPNLVRTNIELLHLGNPNGEFHYGRIGKGSFFKK